MASASRSASRDGAVRTCLASVSAKWSFEELLCPFDSLLLWYLTSGAPDPSDEPVQPESVLHLG